MSKVPLRAMFHNPSFLAVGVPVWDIRNDFGETNMLVSNSAIGKSLAAALGDKPVVLMRGHGDVTVGPTVKMAVFRAYYTDVNAKLQAQALALGGEPNYLTPGEGVESRPNQFRRHRSDLEPVADEGFADARQIVPGDRRRASISATRRHVHQEVREHRRTFRVVPDATARETTHEIRDNGISRRARIQVIAMAQRRSGSGKRSGIRAAYQDSSLREWLILGPMGTTRASRGRERWAIRMRQLILPAARWSILAERIDARSDRHWTQRSGVTSPASSR